MGGVENREGEMEGVEKGEMCLIGGVEKGKMCLVGGVEKGEMCLIGGVEKGEGEMGRVENGEGVIGGMERGGVIRKQKRKNKGFIFGTSGCKDVEVGSYEHSQGCSP